MITQQQLNVINKILPKKNVKSDFFQNKLLLSLTLQQNCQKFTILISVLQEKIDNTMGFSKETANRLTSELNNLSFNKR